MKTKKCLEISWETHEITTISFKGDYPPMLFCQSCQTETRHLSVAEVAVIARVSEADVFREAESGQVHWLERADGKFMICADSISTNI